MEGDGQGSRHSGRERAFLSLFFLLHFGAVAVLLAPSAPESVEVLPEGLRAPVRAVVVPGAKAAWPVAAPYLRLTATSQNWKLFAPEPARWTNSVRVVAYYPAGNAVRAGTGEATGPRGVPTGPWRADTLLVTGPRETPFPHLTGHRPYRVLFNMGMESWADSYRPVFARYLCRTLRDARGRRPDGLSILAEWERVRIPWRPPPDPELHHQELGGFTCPESS